MLSDYSVKVLIGSILCISVVLILASSLHHRYHFTKGAFYTVLAGIIISSTTALAIINLRAVQLSENGSLTRRTGRLSVLVCDQQLRLSPSGGLLNQTSGDAGHQIFADGRVQFLGYIENARLDGALGGFFRSLGGSITASSMAIPLTTSMQSQVDGNASLQKFVRSNPLGEKYLELRSGEACDTAPSMVSIFVYEKVPGSDSYVQKRLLRTPEEYAFSSGKPNEASCVVVIFGNPSERTDRTCGGYPDIKKVTYSEDDL